MKKKFWIVLLSVVLTLALAVTAIATILPGDVDGDGRITAFDAQMIAESKAGKRTLTAEQQEAAGEFSVKDLIYTVLNVTGDPIAEVTNGDAVAEVVTVQGLQNSIAADGNTVVKLLADIDHNQLIKLPYSCTLDLNGHTIRTNPNTNSGIEITKAGSKNATTTIKNGELYAYYIGIKVMKGGIALENMTVETRNGPAVGLYDNAANDHAITNSTLVSPSSCISFMSSATDYSATTTTISNATLVANNASASSNVIFTRNGAQSVFGNVVFGDNVNMYSYTADPALGALENTFFNGELVAKESSDASVTVGETTYTGMNLWTTEPTNEPIKILMIGNSFCLSFTEELYKLAAEAGKEIYICNLYYGGCSIERHWKSLTGEWNTVYNGFYTTDALGRAKHNTILNAYDAVHYKDWDIISLQQHFDVARTETNEKALASCTPYAENMYNYMRENFPNAELYWHQTWAYEVGYVSSVANVTPCPDVATQSRQRDAIYYASQALADSCNVDLIPCGKAWEIARANPNVVEDPCKDDKCHDGTVEGGQYINACTWFETLFKTSCVGSEVISFSDYSLDPALAAELQQAAHEAVAQMYGEDYAK